jgi:anti-sigma B factor antagonist
MLGVVDVSSVGSSVRVGRSGLDPPPLPDVGVWLTDAWITATAGPSSLGIEQSDAAPDGSVTVRVLCDLDLCSSPELRATLERLAATTRLTVLDLSATDFMDCSGLSVVLQAARSSHARRWSFIVARERSAPVARLIDLVGVGGAFSQDGTPEHHAP